MNICSTVEFVLAHGSPETPRTIWQGNALSPGAAKGVGWYAAKFENLAFSTGGLGRMDSTVTRHTSRLREALSSVNKHSSGHKPRTLDRDYLYFIILKNK